MLAIRLQRTGRSGHAQFRVVVQDARRTPTSGNIVAALGHYNPHAKTAVINKEKAAFYLEHGAQPSDRVVRLLNEEGIKLPSWVKVSPDKKRSVRNPEKLRRNRPAEEKPTATQEAPGAETASVDEKPEVEANIEPETATTTESANEVPAVADDETVEQGETENSPEKSNPEASDQKDSTQKA